MLLKIREEDRKLGTIGSETAANIGNFLKDQYERIPEDKRQGFEQGVSEAATGIQELNRDLREQNTWGGIGPLDPFIAAGKAYNTIAEPIKKELSIQTGLAPAWIEAGEVTADFLLPAIPLTAASKGKKLKKAVDYTNRIKNVSNVLDDTTSLNKKIRKILATNSQMSYGQARELALLELKGVRPTGNLYRNRPDKDGLLTIGEVPVDHDLEFALRQQKPKSIKQITLEDRLNDPRIEKFLTGKGKLQSKELSNLVQDFSDREDFMGVVSSRIEQLKEKYPHLVRKLDNQKETIALRWHHVNPSKGPIDLYKGLTDPADRGILRDTLVNEFEVFSGNHPLNNRGLSIDVHDQIHDWLGENVGLRADVLKHKWAKAAGVNVGNLEPGKGFMANHQVLSPQGRDAFDAWFSKLKPDERLPYIREYGGIIKESEGILGDLMQQYDALFAVPEGFRLTPDNDVLLRFLDELPTDGSRPLQKDVKAIVEQVNREMPRGTVNIINEEGVVKQLNLESDIYKRIIEVKAKLDATKDLRKARSLKNELKDLEAGILQKTLDFSGAQKQGAWKKRLEQEKLRRQGK